MEPVVVRNISGKGSLLEADRCAACRGETVVLRWGTNRSRFRVAWVGKTPDEQRMQIGLEHVPQTAPSWGPELPPPTADDYLRPRLQVRRNNQRFSREVAVELRPKNSMTPVWTSTKDVSEGGCYAYMLDTLPVSTVLDVALWIGEIKIWTEGVVVSSLSGSGVGIKFNGLSPEDRRRLREGIEGSEAIPDRRAEPQEIDISNWDSDPELETCDNQSMINSFI